MKIAGFIGFLVCLLFLGGCKILDIRTEAEAKARIDELRQAIQATQKEIEDFQIDPLRPQESLCSKICACQKAICEASDAICKLAQRWPTRDDFQKACLASQKDCEKAKARCLGCAPPSPRP